MLRRLRTQKITYTNTNGKELKQRAVLLTRVWNLKQNFLKFSRKILQKGLIATAVEKPKLVGLRLVL